MKDLGLMGESTFSLWCGDAGLIPNGSQIDKTGWDFYVEFPNNTVSHLPVDIQGSPIECKVQVKATDKRNRRSSITLSNLRRLITAPLPTFILFIEFDNTNSAKNAFLVHVDQTLIKKVLKRLRTVEQVNNKTDFNKRTISIKYDNNNRIQTLDGAGLKSSILKHIPNSLETYISNKLDFLQTTGFEDGFATFRFNTTSVDNLKKLIDVSIGLKDSVEVEGFTGSNVRFGISDRKPFVSGETGKISMPDIKPYSKGIIRFRDNKLSPHLSFDVNLYISPLNPALEDSLKTIRIEGDFFNFVMNPFSGKASYTFSLGEGLRINIRKFRDTWELLSKLSYQDNEMNIELEFEGMPLIELPIATVEMNSDFDFKKEMVTLEYATKIADYFNLVNDIEISLSELISNKQRITQYIKLIECNADITIEFGVDGDDFDSSNDIRAITFINLILGDYMIGVIVSLLGDIKDTCNNMYELTAKHIEIEQKLVSKKGKVISKDDIEVIYKEIDKKYENSEQSVVIMRS